MITVEYIEKVQIELTTRCQASCPMCPRNYRGYDYNSGYPLTELSVDDLSSILMPVKDNLTLVNFNGNLGDFSSAKDGVECVKWLIDNTTANIEIMTNGSARTPEWWAKLANPRVVVTFDLDGLEDTHHLYRIGTSWQRIVDNANGYIAAGGRARWQMIDFKHNKHQVSKCEELSKELGFEDFYLLNAGRDQGPVYNKDGSFAYWIGDEQLSAPPIDIMLDSHKTYYESIDLDKISPDCIECESSREQEIYIAADGSIYPCCYLGFYPDTMGHPGNDQLIPIMKDNNALAHGLKHAIEWFSSIEQTWVHKTVSDGLLYGCATSCGRSQ